MDVCRREEPTLAEVGDGRKVSCWLHANGKEAAS
jgi:oligopeptide transport system ATP-binding protein